MKNYGSRLGLFLMMAFPWSSGATSLTVVVTNLPAWSEFAEGQSVALVGTVNGWNNNATLATVNDHTLVFSLADIGTPTVLGTGWGDVLEGANVAFQLVKPGTFTSVVKADFLSNEGNFRLAVQNGASNLVQINAGPVPYLIDQDSAVAVNGVRADPGTLVDPMRFAYPGGRWKALVMSYDDGHDQDRGLAPLFDRHGIRGTFHLCNGWFNNSTFLTSAEVPTLLARHEISIHTVDHPTLTQIDDGAVRWEVGNCRYVLGGLAGYAVNSMSYPMGGYDRRVMNLLAGEGVTCSRTVQAANSLDYFPPNYRKWHPTCHHADADGFADQLLGRGGENLSLLFIWGHSYELDNTYANNSWAYMESLATKLGDRGDIWYAGMGELRDYLAAAQAMNITSNLVHNPSSQITVWTKLQDQVVPVRPGRTLAYPAGRVTVRPAILYEQGQAIIAYQPEGNALAGSTSLWLHVGYDGWQQTHDVSMTNEGNGMWSASCDVPHGVRRLNWVFLNEYGVLDDGLGQDWQAPVRARAADSAARAYAMPNSPVLLGASGSGQNRSGESMDLEVVGGALVTSNQGGFGSFGRVYVNYDTTNLYVGAEGCQLDGANNGMILFLSVDTLADGVSNLWSLRGNPAALGNLHNVSFTPAANVALVLGDEFGDGTYPHFILGSGYDFGQGAYRLSALDAFAVPLRGARLAQFDGMGNALTVGEDDDGDRSAERWEVAIPWTSLNAPLGIRSLGALHLSGVLASGGLSGPDRYLSGNFLGDTATGTLNGSGDYGFNFVQLYGARVGLPDEDADRDGPTDQWTQRYFMHPQGMASDQSRPGDDPDGDGVCNADEFVAGTAPTNAVDVFTIRSASTSGSVQFATVSGRYYQVQSTTNLADTEAWSTWPGLLCPTGSVTSIVLPTDAPGLSFRLAVLPP